MDYYFQFILPAFFLLDQASGPRARPERVPKITSWSKRTLTNAPPPRLTYYLKQVITDNVFATQFREIKHPAQHTDDFACAARPIPPVAASCSRTAVAQSHFHRARTKWERRHEALLAEPCTRQQRNQFSRQRHRGLPPSAPGA